MASLGSTRAECSRLIGTDQQVRVYELTYVSVKKKLWTADLGAHLLLRERTHSRYAAASKRSVPREVRELERACVLTAGTLEDTLRAS